MKTKLEIKKYTSSNATSMPGKWFIGADNSYFQYLWNDGVIRNTADAGGWFATREAARKAVRLYRQKNS